MPKEPVVIVIPIYKAILSADELASLQQCIKILKKHPIVFFGSDKLDVTVYKNALAGEIPFNIEYFDDVYFKNIDGYNKLMLSTSFYERFKKYQYMLIYQLDAWVFTDELQYWCNKGYDYIGAPWIDADWCAYCASHITLTRRIAGKLGYTNFNLVGNGGFSLRKISSFLFNLKLFSKKVKSFDLNEDFFYSYFINSYNVFFKVAPFNVALKFSFEVKPEMLLEQNNGKLPFGCHAWLKRIDFWQDYISI